MTATHGPFSAEKEGLEQGLSPRQLIVYRPSSGSFVSYSREFFGEKVAFVSRWLHWFNWAMTYIADDTALTIYFKRFGQYLDWINDEPQAVFALVCILSVLLLNLMSVKMFGELEFWFSAIKVSALLFFLVLGTYFVTFGTSNGSEAGFPLITDNGGLYPNGVLPAVVVVQGIVFTYLGIELVGTYTLASSVLLIPILIYGWKKCRANIK